MAVVAARFRVRLADEPDPTGAVRPHPARPRNLAAIFAPADRMRRSGVHGVRGRAWGRRPRHRRAALHGRAAAFGSRRVRVAGRHRRARGARPARHRPPQQDKPGGRDQRRAVREGRRRPEGGLTEDPVIGRGGARGTRPPPASRRRPTPWGRRFQATPTPRCSGRRRPPGPPDAPSRSPGTRPESAALRALREARPRHSIRALMWTRRRPHRPRAGPRGAATPAAVRLARSGQADQRARPAVAMLVHLAPRRGTEEDDPLRVQRSMGPGAGPKRPSDWERSRAATSPRGLRSDCHDRRRAKWG